MEKLRSLLAGFAGSVALNLLHESMRKQDREAPRVDKVGKEALARALNYFGAPVPGKKELYQATLASDLVGNAFYYSLIGAGDPRFVWPRGVMYGLMAGVGAVQLPEPMGLNPDPVTRTTKTKVLTAGYYLFGALVTAAVFNMIRKK
ncbi:hypothetical protein C7T94_13275 [Pedobacter yulinensis]|uniref:DUF1440 domain-containing protein n=1 Tax=Pedobacter yulinensis TaxID=2126353 RepID=A0A2T3HM60_9SPHI|nr:hypothetical protein [Pedobacter yulinensis]PST83519.1 hypothetical protein C7T94_13275 [Pedobacter yulinensis]